jgi:hypothetical protein
MPACATRLNSFKLNVIMSALYEVHAINEHTTYICLSVRPSVHVDLCLLHLQTADKILLHFIQGYALKFGEQIVDLCLLISVRIREIACQWK